ncbi:hypothetical protein COV15_02780 [Candidatus Woesearchaeota archaeon CG10_big_fil_rev_8_21_14_0_10_34_12]|nr:MAG: hypothetical protein COV15_02780 [Candidatus Woesearchaeota archaeon CG10_big_fil_rev_8_21_14_0_10_34_12]
MQVIKVPGINGLGKTVGCEKAGNKVISALSDIRANESGKKIEKEGLDLEEIHLDNSNLELTNKLIYENSFEGFGRQDKIIFLGGDHSISYSIVKAFKDYFDEDGKKPFLAVFDAHPDLMPALKEPTHEEWLRKLIEDGFPRENIILVSVRNSYEDELNFIRENGIAVVDMKTLNEDVEGVCDMIMEKARSADEFYISVDIDCLDSAYAPATGYSEPGGMTTRQLIYMIQRLKLLKNFKAADIVEVNPDKQGGEMTVKTAAKILAELI